MNAVKETMKHYVGTLHLQWILRLRSYPVTKALTAAPSSEY